MYIYDHVAFVHPKDPNNIIIYGGKNHLSEYQNKIYELDIKERVWKVRKSTGIPPTPRSSLGVCQKVNSNQFYLYGGSTDQGISDPSIFELTICDNLDKENEFILKLRESSSYPALQKERDNIMYK